MKKLLSQLLQFLVLFAQPMLAQKLTVERFIHDQEKVYGSTEARKDGTGEQYCALVLVQLPTLQGVIFDGEIVNPIEPKGGEYWVYMVAGSKYLRIKHPSVHPLEIKFADYGVGPLQPKATYVLTINVPQVGQSPTTQYVTFALTPVVAGAKVTVNGEVKRVNGEGKTSFSLYPGHYTYQVQADGFEWVQSEFTMTGEKQQIDVALRTSQAELTVNCQTADAKIYIDDEYKGIVPWTGTLYPQNYNVEVRKEGFATQSKKVTLVQDTPQTLNFDALIPLVGNLDVAYEPEGTDIILDGKLVGQTPQVINNLAVGPHSLELRKEGYQSFSQRVTIEEGKISSLSGCLVQTTTAQTSSVPSSSLMSSQSSAASQVTANGSVRTFTVKGVTFTMIAVQGGTFEMGATSEQEKSSANETSVHTVTLSDYSIGETEVTQELWKAVMGKNMKKYAQEINSKTHGVGANYPMYYVSWDDCQEFIKKLNQMTGAYFRLPTEAEWEYAARGGTHSRKTQYAGSNNIDEVAWYDHNTVLWNRNEKDNSTHPVKTKLPNELGLYDMSGNVGEWCQDWFANYSGTSITNPIGPLFGKNRVSRGGGWYGYSSYCRLASRDSHDPASRLSYLGLRLAL